MRYSRYFGCFFSSTKPKASLVVPEEQMVENSSPSFQAPIEAMQDDVSDRVSVSLPVWENYTPAYEDEEFIGNDECYSSSSKEEDRTKEIFIGTPRLEEGGDYIEYSPRNRVQRLLYGNPDYEEGGSEYISGADFKDWKRREEEVRKINEQWNNSVAGLRK